MSAIGCKDANMIKQGAGIKKSSVPKNNQYNKKVTFSEACSDFEDMAEIRW